MQLKVVWNLLLQAGSEGPALISCAVFILKCARGALAEVYLTLLFLKGTALRAFPILQIINELSPQQSAGYHVGFPIVTLMIRKVPILIDPPLQAAGNSNLK